MSEPSKTSAIVLDLDGVSIERCLRSLLAQTLGFEEIIVVDNGSRWPLLQRLPVDLQKQLRILRSDVNLGFTGGVNLAMASVASTNVALINNDVELDVAWLASLLPFLAGAGVAAVQSVLTAPDGRIDGAGIEIVEGRVRQLGHGEVLGALDTSRFWGVSATAAVYKVSALRDVSIQGSILHPRFFAYYEDVELAARLFKGGFTMQLVPVMLAVHAGSATAETLGSRALFLRVRNRYLVARLHPGVLSRRSLLIEDLRRLGKGLRGLRFADVPVVIRGVIAGIVTPL